MTLWKMLKNPIALVAQGFAVGGFLFLVASPVGSGERPAPDSAGESILSTLEA